MKVFKFGGASVNSADAVRNVGSIINKYKNDNLLVVVSAMGKTTNALEQLTTAYINNQDVDAIFNTIKEYHFNIIKDLFNDVDNSIYNEANKIFDEISKILKHKPKWGYDIYYNKIVINGELLSTKIIHHYLSNCGIKNRWINAQSYVFTDNSNNDANVNWQATSQAINYYVLPNFVNKKIKRKIVITQGFIAKKTYGGSTTLGREGSDYSASIFAYCLDAEEVIIWKDVPGVLNADPKYFNDTQKLDSISYREAIELAYYGASIIHPKTIKPLQNKNIPLKVKSFIHPDEVGTIISNIDKADGLVPSFIVKHNQTLVSISPRDFSFIAEENLSDIFKTIAETGIKINLMQNSAISFSICIDENNFRFEKLISRIQKNYLVKYNKKLELITIRHYDQQTIDKIVNKRKIYLEQKSRLTAQLIVGNENRINN